MTWKSQPTMTGTKIPAGKFLLCFAILMAGGSASKVFQIFTHMGLSCISLNTFFEHQRISNSFYSMLIPI
jgi:ABC-type microcin C transport system permease subunit YejB